jgi:hypothetical protein
MPELMEPEFILQIARILAFGAKKYSRDNWKECDDPSRYMGALLRHALAFHGGETTDPETDQSHLAHVAVNAMFLWWVTTYKGGN